MTDKQMALEILNKLPETSSMQEIAEEITIMVSIRRGEEAADAGHVHSHEEVKKMFTSWIQNGKEHQLDKDRADQLEDLYITSQKHCDKLREALEYIQRNSLELDVDRITKFAKIALHEILFDPE